MKTSRRTADALVVITEELPPLTGSRLFDPWRIRLRLDLAGELQPPPRRAGPTRSEVLLWERLEGEDPVWVREHVTGPYRLDFYCPSVRLAVEVDGASHWGEAAGRRDELRDAWHAARGIVTKRFSTREVESEPDWVHAEVVRLVRALLGAAEDARAQTPDWTSGSPAFEEVADLLRAAACETVLPAHSPGPGLLRQLLAAAVSAAR